MESVENTGDVVLIETEDRRWWPLAVSVGASVLSALLAAGLALTVSHRQVEASAKVQGQIQAALEAQRTGLCAFVVRLDDNARREPPSTQLGRDNAVAYAQFRLAYRCDQG